MQQPKFFIGQLVHHKLFGYRGVVYDVDLEFGLSPEWYRVMAKSRPPKDKPWYRVLVHEASHETYVAEQNLELDDSRAPIAHPLLDEHFDTWRDGHYERTRDVN